MTQQSILNANVMSDGVALGFFDADGGILLGTEFKTYLTGRTWLSYKVVYFLGQSLTKSDAVEKFAEKFGGKVLYDEKAADE